MPLTDEKKRSAFYQAVTPAHPELRSANLIRGQSSQNVMKLDEMKMFLFQLESEKKLEATQRNAGSRT